MNTYDETFRKLNDPQWDSTGICRDVRNRLFRDGDLEATAVMDWRWIAEMAPSPRQPEISSRDQYFWAMSAQELRAIADELDIRNKDEQLRSATL